MRGVFGSPHINKKIMAIKKNHLMHVLCFLFLSNLLIGQTFEDDSDIEEVDGEEIIINSDTISPEIFAGLGFDTTPNPRSQTIQGNSVFVQQIGELNSAAILTNTQASEINLLQQGNSNLTVLDYNALTAITNVSQLGDFNLVTDFINNPTENVSLDLIQQGDNLTFERFGSNSITRSLRFIQTEASPTIIIRSFQ